MFKWLISLITIPTEASLEAKAAAAAVTAARVNGFKPLNWGRSNLPAAPSSPPIEESPAEKTIENFTGKVIQCRILRDGGCHYAYLAISCKDSSHPCGKMILLKSRQFDSLLAVDGDIVSFSVTGGTDLTVARYFAEKPLESFSIDWFQRRTRTGW